jgi:uncharacterized membrane protein
MISTRTLTVALIVSGALNLFLVGGIAGAAFMRHRIKTEYPVVAAVTGREPLWTAGRGLSVEHRQGLRDVVREANQANRPESRQARSERRAVWQSFADEPFDARAASRRLADARALDARTRGRVDEALVAYAATLPQPERAALADGLQRLQAGRGGDRPPRR